MCPMCVPLKMVNLNKCIVTVILLSCRGFLGEGRGFVLCARACQADYTQGVTSTLSQSVPSYNFFFFVRENSQIFLSNLCDILF